MLIDNKTDQINKIAQLSTHAVAGLIAGEIANGEGLSRAAGAIIGELVGDIVKENLRTQGRYDPSLATYSQDIQQGLNMAALVATVVSGVFGLDQASASQSARIVAEENALACTTWEIVEEELGGIPDLNLDEVTLAGEKKIRIAERLVDEYVKDVRLTPDEKRTLVQAAVNKIDAALRFATHGLGLEYLNKDISKFLQMTLENIRETSHAGQEVGGEFAKFLNLPDSVKPTFEEMGGMVGVVGGAVLSLKGQSAGRGRVVPNNKQRKTTQITAKTPSQSKYNAAPSPEIPSTVPPAGKATQATSGVHQVRQNNKSGRSFQNHVHANLRIPENKTVYSVLLRDKGKVLTIPDLPLSSAGVTDIKNVQYITFTEQLQAQAALAKQQGKSFNLIISPNTQKISEPLWETIRTSNGKVLEFNPTTKAWIERILDGNKVVR